jgi:hypothetical protein
VSTAVCFTAKKGGHFWVPLNWTLGLRALGCDVIWLEPIDPKTPVEEIWKLSRLLKDRLEPYGLGDSVALCSITTEPLDPAVTEECLDIDAASELSTLLVNLRCDLPAQQVRRFHRSACLMQMWVSVGRYSPPRHDLHFTIGETVGSPMLGSPRAESNGITRRRPCFYRSGRRSRQRRLRPTLQWRIGGAIIDPS